MEEFENIERLDIDGSVLSIRIVVFASSLALAAAVLVAIIRHCRHAEQQDDDAIMEIKQPFFKRIMGWLKLVPWPMFAALILLLICGFLGLINYILAGLFFAGLLLGSLLGYMTSIFDEGSLFDNLLLMVVACCGVIFLMYLFVLMFGAPTLSSVLGCAIGAVISAEGISS